MTRPFFARISSPVVLTLALSLCLGFSVFSPTHANAQVNASIKGTVRDATGAVVSGASVVLRNTDTNLSRTTTSNDAGYYSVPDVLTGNYELKVSKQGFRTAVQSGISLGVNQTVVFDLALATGSTAESITVQASAVSLETATAELGVGVTRREVNDLPLNGRNFTKILNLTPGVSTVNVSQNAPAASGIWSNPVGTSS